MLNKNLHLKENPKDLAPTRKGFGEGLLEAGKEQENIVALCADLTESTQMHLFKEAFPKRFVQIGVAEQNLATVASGMAAMGKLPFISSYAMFSPGRNWEQIRTTIAYNDRPVIIIGSHSGISVGPDGGTHQAVEDIALMRVMPNMIVVYPCDAQEAKKATLALAKLGKPAYLRLAREKTPVITTEETPFEIGKAQIFWDTNNPRITIIATGTLTHKALIAAETLQEEGIETRVVNLSTIKPLDTKTILASVQKVQGVVTVEEHQIAGGMGSAVAELLAQEYPLPIQFVGVHDQFGQSGKIDELWKHYNMDENGIMDAVRKILNK